MKISNLTLRGEAYLDHDTKRGCYYTTTATDSMGDYYRLYWLVSEEEIYAVFNGDEVCDWNNPDEIQLIND